MKISLTSIMVQDQAHALAFYTDVLGFETKVDIPMGEFRWMTVVSPEEPDGTQLVLEPNAQPDAAIFQTALYESGVPYTAFQVDDVEAEAGRLKEKGVSFTTEPSDVGTAIIATFDDTCGNLIQIYQEK